MGGDGSAELIGCLPCVSGNKGEFMLDHDPTFARLRLQPMSWRLEAPWHRDSAEMAGQGRTDAAMPHGQGMAKAVRILAALKRDGWIETRRSASHRVLVKGDHLRIWAYHDGVDLGGPALARIARDYGYTVDELRKL